jgi:allantoate deiminase
MSQATDLLVSMLDELGHLSDEPGRITRTFLSPAMREANRLVGDCMNAAGLQVREDSVGNLIGRYEVVGGQLAGAQSARASSLAHKKTKTLLLGSHLDSVRDAGRFDGPLGVLLPIVALADLKVRGVKLPFNVEVLGFSEEEGVRFASAYLGSEGYTGRLKESALQLTDANGVTVRQALEEFGGSFSIPKAAHKRGDLLGYVEVHIEQGPVLEAKKLAVGVVSAIAGQSRVKQYRTGEARAAGTGGCG